jgi:hypothetical protein
LISRSYGPHKSYCPKPAVFGQADLNHSFGREMVG